MCVSQLYHRCVRPSRPQVTSLAKGGANSATLVLVEATPGEAPCVVGVLQTRLLTGIKGANLSFEATEALTLRSGRAGLRLTKDGDVELLGTRISAASRGVMRLVGHVLRLN